MPVVLYCVHVAKGGKLDLAMVVVTKIYFQELFQALQKVPMVYRLLGEVS